MSTFQAKRYELKYLITERQAAAIRTDVATWLKPDEHSRFGGIGYRVQSLYLDSRSLTCYRQTMSGEKNRFKLRMRYYDCQPETPVFLEVKRRITNVIQKSRAAVRRDAALQILRGAAAKSTMLLNNNPKQRDALTEFCSLRDRLGAAGAVYVDYYREAFECGSNNQYRVTFDRNICGGRYTLGDPLTTPIDSIQSGVDGVVLEMKFINQPARWMLDIARRHGIGAISVPKYIECFDVAGKPELRLIAAGGGVR